MIIGITTRNRRAILTKAIDSASDQDYANKFTVVMDDASTDGTETVRDSYPDVAWIRHDPPRGLRENRNTMMQYPNVDYYVSLDDDAWFLRNDEISLAVARMEANPKIGAVAFDILSPCRTEVANRTSPRSTSHYIGCGHIVRIAAAREAGWYEASPGPYGAEEKDLCIRLKDLGYTVELMPGVHVWHEKEWTGRDWYPLQRSGVCNDLTLALRRCPFPDCLLVLPYKIFSHVRYGLRNRNLLKPTLAGIILFFKHALPNASSRRPVKRATFWQRSR